MKIAVAGATGVVGRHVVELAQRSGHDVVALTRASGVDLMVASTLDGLLTGVNSLIDVSNSSKFTRRAATHFFTTATTNLTNEAERAHVGHYVSLSIVGIDRASTYGYYRAKLAQEKVVTQSAVPTSLVRATQFHEFASQILARVRVGPVAFVPHMKVQTVAARSVAELLIEIATNDPLPEICEVAGPDIIDIVSNARDIAQRRDGPRVIALPVIGSFARSVNEGVLLPSSDARIVGPSFEMWLNELPLT